MTITLDEANRSWLDAQLAFTKITNQMKELIQAKKEIIRILYLMQNGDKQVSAPTPEEDIDEVILSAKPFYKEAVKTFAQCKTVYKQIHCPRCGIFVTESGPDVRPCQVSGCPYESPKEQKALRVRDIEQIFSSIAREIDR